MRRNDGWIVYVFDRIVYVFGTIFLVVFMTGYSIRFLYQQVDDYFRFFLGVEIYDYCGTSIYLRSVV